MPIAAKTTVEHALDKALIPHAKRRKALLNELAEIDALFAQYHRDPDEFLKNLVPVARNYRPSYTTTNEQLVKHAIKECGGKATTSQIVEFFRENHRKTSAYVLLSRMNANGAIHKEKNPTGRGSVWSV